jgi:hypothetical protein
MPGTERGSPPSPQAEHEVAHEPFAFADRDEVEAGAQRRLRFGRGMHTADDVQHARIGDPGASRLQFVAHQHEVGRVERPADQHARVRRNAERLVIAATTASTPLANSIGTPAVRGSVSSAPVSTWNANLPVRR